MAFDKVVEHVTAKLKAGQRCTREQTVKETGCSDRMAYNAITVAKGGVLNAS